MTQPAATVLGRYADLFAESFTGYARYLWHEVTHPGWGNYITALLVVSVACFVAEQLAPWRKDQPRIRKDFWLDAFYMLFNFSLFGLIGYAALSEVVSAAFLDGFEAVFGVRNLVAIRVAALPVVVQLAVMFVLRDFIHWNIHRLLHRSNRLWEFHKVHHSVRQMGFAAHLRYHWMETIVYRTLEYLPLALLGFGIDDFFVVHLVALTIGHVNHSNVRLPVGPLKYVLNTPQMHIWHHARRQPGNHGCNFGLSLSVWDWIFGTAFWPEDGRDAELGFDGIEEFPEGLAGQMAQGFGGAKK